MFASRGTSESSPTHLSTESSAKLHLFRYFLDSHDHSGPNTIRVKVHFDFIVNNMP